MAQTLLKIQIPELMDSLKAWISVGRSTEVTRCVRTGHMGDMVGGWDEDKEVSFPPLLFLLIPGFF